jgi:hypothetical protein
MCIMKRFALLSVTTALFLLLLSASALAATIDINGRTGILNISAGEQTIFGDSGGSLLITCDEGVILTLDGATVTSSGCALTFTGTGNAIILAAGTTNSFTSATNYPGISVKEGVELTISGSGTLTATGGTYGAGIGGGSNSMGGTITISGGTVNATSKSYGAGIGGGSFGSGGTISISDGTVNVTGGGFAAGIGGGTYGDGGTITISGGTVTVTGSAGSAGIGGGGEGSSGGTINISGGTVDANGGEYGAGIGGAAIGSAGTVSISGGTVTANGGHYGPGIGAGYQGGGGTVDISGGKVYAARGGSTSAQDIGSGASGSGVTFTLSDGAAVFLENDSYAVPTILGTQTHYNPVPFVGNTANGITVPAAWTTARGAFLPPYVPKPAAVSVPQTGDSSLMGLWIALAAVAGAAVASILIVSRKRRAA